MIEIKESYITDIICHRVSNDESKEFMNREKINLDKIDEEENISNIFLKPFVTKNNVYTFNHKVSMQYNIIYQATTDIYKGKDFVEKSQEIFKHLSSVSKHPNIKDGDLFIIKFEDLLIKDKFYEAVGIYKVETKKQFIETTISKDGKMEFSSKKGISTNKLDKAALIIFTEKVPLVYAIDTGKTETRFWLEEFLNIIPIKDSYHNTEKAISLYQDFIENQLSSKGNISKAEQAILINKSINLLKSKDNIDLQQFTQDLFSNPEIINMFNEYKEVYEQKQNITIENNFKISEQALKNKKKSTSIIKLDDNFEIYIKNSGEYIQRGYDEISKKYFYKLLFDKEK